jgi:hypothetical protein
LTTQGAQAPGVVVMMQRVTDDRQIFGIDQQPLQFMVGPDGRFGGSGLAAGQYYASYTPPDPGAAPITKALFVPQVDTHRCLIQYADAAVEGYVVDGDNNPVAGASVLASVGDGIQDATAFTDAEGRFFVRGLEPGHLVLTASHTDFAPSNPAELDLRDGSAEGPIILELLPHDGASIQLTVNTAAGSAGGAPVYLVGPETSTGFTDGGGFATFSGIPAGSYRPASPTAAPPAADQIWWSTTEISSRPSSTSVRGATSTSIWMTPRMAFAQRTPWRSPPPRAGRRSAS